MIVAIVAVIFILDVLHMKYLVTLQDIKLVVATFFVNENIFFFNVI